MSEWPEVPLRDLVTHVASGPSPTSEERPMSGDEWGLLKTTAVTWQRGWSPSAHKVPPRSYWGNRSLEVQAGDVIITKAGPRHRVGVAAYVREAPPRLMVSGKMVLLRPDPGKVAPPFLALALATRSAQEYLDHRTTGMAESQANFSNSALLGCPLKLPPLEDQRWIAEILDTLDETIQATDHLLVKLRSCVRPLLDDLFTSLEPSASQLLSDCGAWLSGGTPSTTERRFWGGGIPWITSSSLKSKYLRVSERTLTSAGVTAGSRLVGAGTIVFVVRGMSLKSEFRVGIAGSDLAFGQDCKAIVPEPTVVPEYLWAFLTYKESQILSLVDEASHGTGRLQTALIGAIEVPVPTVERQKWVVSRLAALERRIDTESAWVEKLRLQRVGLAAELLTGRVRTVTS